MPKKSAVLQFIEEQRATGASDKQIRHQLLDAGWQMDIIQHAMEGTTAHPPVKVAPAQAVKRGLPGILLHPYFIGVSFLALVLLALFI